MRWRVIGDKIMQLMGLVKLRGKVWDWLRGGSLRLLGLEPSSANPSTPPSTTAAPSDKQLEYGQIVKHGQFLGVRKTKEAPTVKVTECQHPAAELKGAGNQYSKEVWCGICRFAVEDGNR